MVLGRIRDDEGDSREEGYGLRNGDVGGWKRDGIVGGVEGHFPREGAAECDTVVAQLDGEGEGAGEFSRGRGARIG